ncbi:uncharacterized protein MYCFIDRAFT_207887 [Pseudocercospora fijiensis CIRAD86]|uniref:C2H2-type domain-containing protein n=1 Tax=Pseudocercospora fijiensis (strain CIRAD86) TaxID=383855 RepID=M3AAH0_PSEFD|nr:uncharacterized protein MYCFIDRAFT_207887 [Pseudocercospora fijiensis CIRAD86]EME81596.1 hypothetical protein MYCFIDRAFT_207887 [Pseudocercospora fijiensis CIRAD86]
MQLQENNLAIGPRMPLPFLCWKSGTRSREGVQGLSAKTSRLRALRRPDFSSQALLRHDQNSRRRRMIRREHSRNNMATSLPNTISTSADKTADLTKANANYQYVRAVIEGAFIMQFQYVRIHWPNSCFLAESATPQHELGLRLEDPPYSYLHTFALLNSLSEIVRSSATFAGAGARKCYPGSRQEVLRLLEPGTAACDGCIALQRYVGCSIRKSVTPRATISSSLVLLLHSLIEDLNAKTGSSPPSPARSRWGRVDETRLVASSDSLINRISTAPPALQDPPAFCRVQYDTFRSPHDPSTFSLIYSSRTLRITFQPPISCFNIASNTFARDISSHCLICNFGINRIASTQKMDLHFAHRSRSGFAHDLSKTSHNYRSGTAITMEREYIEPNWKDAERVDRLFNQVIDAKQPLNKLRNAAPFKDIQTNIDAAARARREARLAQDDPKQARMGQMLQAQALKDGPLPEDEQTRTLQHLSPEAKTDYRVAQRRDAVLDMNSAYADIPNESLSKSTKRIDNDVALSMILHPRHRESQPGEAHDIPREALAWTSDAVGPRLVGRPESLQALFQDDSLVDSRLQLRSTGAIEEPRSPTSTYTRPQHRTPSRRRFLGRRTDTDDNAFGLSKGYELPELIEDKFLRLPASVKNRNGLPNPCGPKEQQHLARWEALRAASTKVDTLDQNITLSNVRGAQDDTSDPSPSEPVTHSGGSVTLSFSSLTLDTEQSATLNADHLGTHKRLVPEHAMNDDVNKESSVRDSQTSRRSARATQPSIKLRAELQEQHGRATPKQSLSSSHPGFQCSICGNKYADKNGLRRHNRNIHPGQSQSSLESFTLPTTTNDRVVCKFCGSDFSSNSTLNRHQRSQHPDREDEFEHGRTTASTTPFDPDLSRHRERSTTLSDPKDSPTMGFKLPDDDAAQMEEAARILLAMQFDTNFPPNLTASENRSPDPARNAPTVTKPRKRPASGPGGVENEEQKSIDGVAERKRKQRRRLPRGMTSALRHEKEESVSTHDNPPVTETEKAIVNPQKNSVGKETPSKSKSKIEERKERRRRLNEMTRTPRSFGWGEDGFITSGAEIFPACPALFLTSGIILLRWMEFKTSQKLWIIRPVCDVEGKATGKARQPGRQGKNCQILTGGEEGCEENEESVGWFFIFWFHYHPPSPRSLKSQF